MKTSSDGITQLMRREGCVLRAYQDSVGVWTIGVGHTAAAGSPNPVPGMVLTADEAHDLLAKDIVQYEACVNATIKRPMSQSQFDAYVSLCYNIGAGGFAHSNTARLFNAGDIAGAADAFMGWCHPASLRGRREAERLQFLAYSPLIVPHRAQTAATVAAPITAAAVVVAAVHSSAGAHSAWPMIAVLGIAVVIGLVAVALHFEHKATAHYAPSTAAAARPAPDVPYEGKAA